LLNRVCLVVLYFNKQQYQRGSIMNKTRLATSVACCISMSWGAAAYAQDPPPPSFVAIEAYLCNYNEGKTRADLDKVIAKWNKWMDDSKSVPYTAWVMTPVLSSVNMPIDVVWLGAWQNGNDMGKGMQAWSTNSGLQLEFDKVISCGEHSNSASVNIRPPHQGWPGKGGVAGFANCTLAEGKTLPDSMAAHRAWATHLDATGSKAGMWAFFPGFGNNNPEWDYKVVTSYPDYLAFGADWEAYTNGQGWRKAMELTAGVVSCDSPRLYHSTTVRDAGINPGT
jgi:hypothetical protein